MQLAGVRRCAEIVCRRKAEALGREIELLEQLPTQLRQVFDAPASDPAAARLFPRAYLDPTEEEAEAEFEALVQPELLRDRLDALELVTASFDRAVVAGEWREIALTPDDEADLLAHFSPDPADEPDWSALAAG